MTTNTLTDRQLAEALRAADASGDSDAIIECENEICDRLNLSGDETEQGLTQYAAEQIEHFCIRQGVR